MATPVKKWDQEVDVVVVGSGGGALVAAIMAHDQGARVVVLERSDKVGGTTARSGGGIWIPLNHHMAEAGFTDSREDAVTYCKRCTAGGAPDELVEVYVDTAHQMVSYLEEHTPLEFRATTMPDYESHLEGGKLGGRGMEPEMYPRSELGEWASKLEPPQPSLMTPVYIEEGKGGVDPVALEQAIVQRMEKDLLHMGNALVAPLLKACVDRGISILLETRARELVQEDGRVVGLRAERDSQDFLVKARGGVVLACGGFEWNERLRAQFLPGPIQASCGARGNEGDGLIMAMEVGADLANMNEVWLYPGTHVPGEEEPDGSPVTRWVLTERTLPHSILVNRYGQRFVDESLNYNDMTKTLWHFDPATWTFPNVPCWVIVDSQFREKYLLVTVLPGEPDPDWLPRDGTLEGLAQKLGIDAQGLEATVERFNGFVREGKDRDFGRGQNPYARWYGDPKAPHPILGTIEKPPFYAVLIQLAAAGTKGGPRTNTKGQVLNVRGRVIPGLYAAGNAMAGVSGPAYWGGGGTIGSSMTWGYISGIDAAKAAKP